MPFQHTPNNIANFEDEIFGINQPTPNAGFEVNRSVVWTTLAVADIPAGGNIGLATNTVDVISTFNVSQTTTGQTLTLPTPTNTAAGRWAFVNNTGTATFAFYGANLAPGQLAVMMWDGNSWNQSAGTGLTTSTQRYHIFSTGTISVTGGVASYIYIQTRNGGIADAVEANAQRPWRAGRLLNFKFRVTTNGKGTATTFDVRLNGVSTTLAISVPAAITGIFTITSTVTTAENDLINYRVAPGSAGGSIRIDTWDTIYQLD